MLKQRVRLGLLIILIILIAGAGLGVIVWATRRERTVTKVMIDGIVNVARLATINCYVSTHCFFDKTESKWTDLDWLWGEPKVLVLASGCIEGSVEMDKATIKVSDDPADPWVKVAFGPGAVKISYPEVGPGDIDAVDADNCLLYDRISNRERNQAKTEAQIRLWMAALKLGIVEKTMKEAETVLGEFLASLGYRCEVTFAWTQEQERAQCLTDKITKYMSLDYKALTSFELDGHPCIFGLRSKGDADIWRINEDPSKGCMLLHYGVQMSPNYKFVRSFQKDGHSYILGLHRDVGANIWSIEPDPSGGLIVYLVKYSAEGMQTAYRALVTFNLGGHPYIFGIHEKVGGNMWRINDDPSTGFTLVEYGVCRPSYIAVTSFQMGGIPLILGRHVKVGTNIWRIDPNPSGGLNFNLQVYGAVMDIDSMDLTSFQLDGQPYILGWKRDGSVRIWRVNPDPNPANTLSCVMDQPGILADCTAVTQFELGGHPYVCGSRPGRLLSVWRISEGPTPSLQLLTQ